MRTTAKLALPALTASLLSAPLLASPAEAATRVPVHVEAIQGVEEGSATFTSDIEGCESGTTTDLMIQFALARPHGVFLGIRRFDCAVGGGFTVRLTATFTESGSSGSWSIVDGYGSLDRVRGSGKLIGVPGPGEEQITDIYMGVLTQP